MNPHSPPDQIAAVWPVDRWRDVSVVVAVSGGADSVALLLAMAELAASTTDRGGGKLVAAHVNHGLRGAASDEDERFVVDLCGTLGLTCEVGRVRPRESTSSCGDGLEAACREARYAFLVAAAERIGARYIVTAHTADDQAETILHHIVRGTGLAGLAGMEMFRPLSPAVTLARPMLDVRRDDVIAYLKTRRQAWREDESNAERRFTRNRIRHELLPQLADAYNADIVGSLLRLGRQAREAHDVVVAEARRLVERCVTTHANGRIVVDCGALVSGRDLYPHAVREMFVRIWRDAGLPRQEMGFAEWDWLSSLALRRADVGRPGGRLSSAAQVCGMSESRILPGGVAVKRWEDRLEILPRPRASG